MASLSAIWFFQSISVRVSVYESFLWWCHHRWGELSWMCGVTRKDYHSVTLRPVPGCHYSGHSSNWRRTLWESRLGGMGDLVRWNYVLISDFREHSWRIVTHQRYDMHIIEASMKKLGKRCGESHKSGGLKFCARKRETDRTNGVTF